MSLFYLVKKHYRVRLSPYGFGELSALLVADISRRRSYQPRYAEFLHIFRHIYSYDVVLVVKKRLCERLCKLSLSDARRSEEHKTSYRLVRVCDACTGAQYRLRNKLYRFVLAYDTLVQNIGQAQKLISFALDQL